MSARSKARKRALDILYAAEMRGQDPVATLDAAIADDEGPTNPWTDALVRGVTAHRERIDELLTTYSQAWTLDRMPAVDRTALRIGVFELLYADDVPPASRSPRPSRWCATCPPTTRPPSSTASSARCSATGSRSPSRVSSGHRSAAKVADMADVSDQAGADGPSRPTTAHGWIAASASG